MMTPQQEVSQLSLQDNGWTGFVCWEGENQPHIFQMYFMNYTKVPVSSLEQSILKLELNPKNFPAG